MKQILYGVDISYADRTINDRTMKTAEQVAKDTHNLIAKLTGDRFYHDFGRLMNESLHGQHPEAAGIEILHVSVNNWNGYDRETDSTKTYPKFTVETNRELSKSEKDLIVDAVNGLITEQLSDVFAPEGKTADLMTLDRPMGFSREWDPDKVAEYFKNQQEQTAFADAVTELSSQQERGLEQ